MKLRNKKGFTIIELVIVIAVIGILTAVLVPTFINLTNKANEAADQSLVKNLNTVLAAAEADVQKGYEKPNNPTDMFTILDAEGYKGETLLKNQKSGKVILYKLSTNRFEFEDGTQSGLDYWEFKKDNAATGEKKYSIYLYDEYNSNAAITVSSGLDVGTNTEATNITYLNAGAAQKAAVRTNGGELTINAANDTVKHYGYASGINILAVAATSYHEHGKVDLAKIANGRIVLTEEAKVGGIHAVATGTGEAAYFNDIAIGVVGKATVPSISRDKVAIDDVASDGKYSQFVLEVQSLKNDEAQPTAEEKDYVWINVTVEGGAKTGADQLVISDTAVTEETKELNTGDNVQVEATETPSSAASSVTEKAETAVYVKNSVEFQNALNDNKKYIVIAQDFTAEPFRVDGDTADRYFFRVSKDVVIDGNNKTITANFGTNGRGIVVDANNVTANISNLTLGGTTARALQLHSGHSNVNFVLNNVNLTSTMYGINICGSTLNVTINAYNCNVTSWGALNVWGNSHNLTFNNCNLAGINDKAAAPSNSFHTICLEADTTKVTSEYSAFNYVHVIGGSITATETNSNKQWAVGFNNGVVGASGSTIELTGVTLNVAASDRVLGTPGGGGNSLIIDGKVVWTNAE